MKCITVYLQFGVDLHQESRNYMTEIFTISLVPVIYWWHQTPPSPLKKTQRIWAIWKSGQYCIGGQPPSLPLTPWRRLCRWFSEAWVSSPRPRVATPACCCITWSSTFLALNAFYYYWKN